MPEFQVKFKRRIDKKVYKEIYSARRRAYKVCLKGGWGQECIVFRVLGDSRYEIGRATATGGDEVIWQFNDQDRYRLNEDGTIKKV